MKASELKKGMIIKEGSEFLIVVDMEHRTPGNLRAIYQAMLKNLLTGRVLNRRFSPSDNVEKAELESKEVQYLFSDHAGYHFMDMASYETLVVSADVVGEAKNFFKENLEAALLYHNHQPVTIELPTSVDLKVTETAPGLRGDTSGKAMKTAKLETGLVVNVPLFVEEGGFIKVDTRTGEYLGRV